VCGDSAFDSATKEEIRSCAAKIQRAGGDTKLPMPTQEERDFMPFRTVDWCDAHPAPLPLREGGDYVGHD
jgi:hypothetical protein